MGFQEKLEEVAQQREEDRKQLERDQIGNRRGTTIFKPRGGEHDVPHLVNLNEDPYLSGRLRHLLTENTPLVFVNPKGRSSDPFWSEDAPRVIEEDKDDDSDKGSD